MAKYIGYGLDEYIAKLDGLQGVYAERYYGKAIYEGAKIVTDAIAQNAARIPVDESTRWRGGDQGMQKGVTRVQYQGLQSSKSGGGLGIAKLKKTADGRDVQAGYHGYNAQKTQKYPGGQPNAMIARAVEGGTSFRQKHPFVAPAVRKVRRAAEEAMKQEIERGIKQTMEG